MRNSARKKNVCSHAELIASSRLHVSAETTRVFEAVIPKINATAPAFAYANYQSETARTIPIFELEEDEP
jgi:hypothetical protein